jgi:hypothetical protein
LTTELSLGGRAVFDLSDVAFDAEAAPGERGPFYAWMLFIWKVNEMVPETFSTDASGITIKHDEPADGWTTEEYTTARIMFPPEGSDSAMMIQADDPRLNVVWDVAYKTVLSGHMHKH